MPGPREASVVWGWVVGQDTQGCRRGRSLIQGGQLLLFVIHALFALGLGAADKQGCQRLQAPGELPWAWVRAVGGGGYASPPILIWSLAARTSKRLNDTPEGKRK